MAEVVVSMLLDRLTSVTEEKVREEVGLLLNTNEEAKSMSSKLEKIRQVLNDADRKVVTDPRIKSWLDKLQEIAYDIDDALDEWEVKNNRRKLKESEDALGSSSEDPRKKVCSFLKSPCACFKRTARHRSIALDIKNINERLDTIDQENEREFKFIPKVVGVSTNRDFKRVETTAFVDESEIVGRDYDKNWIMSKLLPSSSTSSSQGTDEIQVISIWGIGGMGKTTLAQLAFKEIKKGNEFMPIWVFVSDPFDGVKVSRTILDQLEVKYRKNSQLHTLLQRIERSISGKKFFLVLDDVWTEDDTIWKQLRESLSSGAPGSRILVTTRKERVADVMGSTHKHRLGRLSDSDCWLLISRRALNERSDRERKKLKNTGKAIARKCNGMPLAAKAMGGLLRYKTSLQEWVLVLESPMWELKEMKEEVFPAIALSYNELDPAVKRCFSYCAIFPKDSKINVDELIRFWMAQGFLSSSEHMELQGRAYFVDLATRSFFQDFERGLGFNTHSIIKCKMHDVVHDFAQLLTKNECLFLRKGEGAVEVSSANVRHLNLIGDGDRARFTSLFPRLRSLLCYDKVMPPNLFSHLKRVRLLKLNHCFLHDIPKEIGNLIHIRCLDLHGNHYLTKLPEAICDLYNLQTLGIYHCESLRGLPKGIGKLTNLRHLLNRDTAPNFEYPQGFAKLTNLRTLEQYHNSKLGYLKDMHQLQGRLVIWLSGGFDKADAKKDFLKNQKELQELEFRLYDVGLPVIIDDAQPPPNLEILRLGGIMLPKWTTTLTNLREFDFVEDTDKLRPRPDDYPSGYKSFPCLGRFRFLEKLSVGSMKALEHIGQELLGVNSISETTTASFISFPKLVSLEITYCPMWEEWEDISEEEEENGSISILPRLAELRIERCNKLKALPHRLLRKASSLRYLRLSRCQTLWSRYNPKTQDWNKISYIRKVDIIE